MRKKKNPHNNNDSLIQLNAKQDEAVKSFTQILFIYVERLAKFLDLEEYEKAARIRDQIIAYKNEISNKLFLMGIKSEDADFIASEILSNCFEILGIPDEEEGDENYI